MLHKRLSSPLIPLLLFVVILACGVASHHWPGIGKTAADAQNVDASKGSQHVTSGSVPDVVPRIVVPANAPAPDSERSVVETLDDLFETGFQVGQGGSRIFADVFDDVAGLSTSDEKAIGQQVHQMIRRKQKLFDDPATTARLSLLAEPFLTNRKRTDLPIHFSVIDDGTPNAFAHAGGYVYVHTGLLRIMTDDDALQFVIGHEIAHCEHRHCVKSLNLAAKVGEVSGPLLANIASIAWQNIALGYSEDYEFEADEWSYRIMRQQGLSHDRATCGLNVLIQSGTNHCQHDDDAKPALPLIRHVEDHFRSHPSTSDRIQRLGRVSVSLR